MITTSEGHSLATCQKCCLRYSWFPILLCYSFPISCVLVFPSLFFDFCTDLILHILIYSVSWQHGSDYLILVLYYYYCVCECMCVSSHVHPMAHLWKPEDTRLESVLPSYLYVVFRD